MFSSFPLKPICQHMYHQCNIHKPYSRLSELRFLFLLSLFSEGSIEADLILSNTWFKGLISVQRESLQKVCSSERPQPTPTHQYCDTQVYSRSDGCYSECLLLIPRSHFWCEQKRCIRHAQLVRRHSSSGPLYHRRLDTAGSRYATPVLSALCVACRSEEMWRDGERKDVQTAAEFATVGRI
jgi:hypothetical protein